MDEHFIVWMRLAGVPHFRKLYGRIEQPNLKKGDVLKFVIHNNFEVASFKGRKALWNWNSVFGGKCSFVCIRHWNSRCDESVP